MFEIIYNCENSLICSLMSPTPKYGCKPNLRLFLTLFPYYKCWLPLLPVRPDRLSLCPLHSCGPVQYSWRSRTFLKDMTA